MRIDVPTIALVLSVAVAGIYKFANIETAVALNAQAHTHNTKEIRELKQDNKEMLNLIFDRIDTMDGKIDRMIEIIHNVKYD
jgi:TolA-binding protein